MEILCASCLYSGKRRRLDVAAVFPCNHVFCSDCEAGHMSCPNCGVKGPGQIVDFAKLAKIPNRGALLFNVPLDEVYNAARRALAFYEVNNRTQAELVACRFAYKSLLTDSSQRDVESEAVIKALKHRLAQRPAVDPPVPSPLRKSSASSRSDILGSLVRPRNVSEIGNLSYQSRR